MQALWLLLLQHSTVIFPIVLYSTVVLCSAIHYTIACKSYANKAVIELEFAWLLLCSDCGHVHTMYDSSITDQFN